jgi:hypothetical protein
MHFLLTHGHYSIFFISAYSLPSHHRRYFHWCFAFGKDLTGCASVMHSPFLLSGGRQIHTAEPLVLYFTSFAPKMVDPRSIVGATLSRYPITMKGVKKAIYTFRFDDRDDKAQTQDRVLLEV